MIAGICVWGRQLTALFEEGVRTVEVAAQLLVKALRKTDKYLRFWRQRAQVSCEAPLVCNKALPMIIPSTATIGSLITIMNLRLGSR